MPAPTERRRYTAPALEKGLDILVLLSREEAGLTQAEIARALDRSVSEIFRMLFVLAERGYIALDPDTDRYTMTTLLFEVAHSAPLLRRLTAVATPMMHALARRTNQSVHMGILSDSSVLVVGQVDPPARHVMTVRLGTRVDLWRASSGRVIIAFLPEAAFTDALARVPLPETTTEAALRADLANIRRVGYEAVDSFVLRGIVNISAPVIDHTGEAIAAITMPHLERYGDPISFGDCVREVIATAARLSRSLGGRVATARHHGASQDENSGRGQPIR